MHPNRAFRFVDDAGMLAWAGQRGFAHIFAQTADGPMVAHAPITPTDGGAFRFHVARGNRIAKHLDGATVLLSVAGADGYISPSWYADSRDSKSVPTWNYVAVEMEGVARMLDDAALTTQLDTLAALHEPRVSPDLPWTRAKTDPAFFDRLLTAIIGFEVTVTAVRGTTKLSQNKSDADVSGVLTGLDRSGNTPLAEAMRA